MNAQINHHLFAETSIDSGALSVACSVVHNFSEPGTYDCSALIGKRTESTFHIAVGDEYPAMQVTVDLATVGLKAAGEACECGGGARAGGRHFEINTKGFVVFYVSRGAGGYAVRATGKLRVVDRPAVFDSRELGQGDIFAVSLLRPGTHTLTNSTGAKGKVVVLYPGAKKGRELYNRAKPVEVRCADKEFIPKEVEAEAAQGQIYRVETKEPSRIKIELAKADDGPKTERASQVFGWRKPRAPKMPAAKKRAPDEGGARAAARPKSK
jgi:hypothetical protein